MYYVRKILLLYRELDASSEYCISSYNCYKYHFLQSQILAIVIQLLFHLNILG